jgi:hypothetical protein
MTRAHFFAGFAIASSLLLTANFAQAELLYGLTEGQQLVTFDSQSRSINSNVAITGLGGDTLLGIDFRPSTGELYGFSNENRFFKINTATGAATGLGNPLNIIDIVKSFDFDPVNDNIRVLTNQRKNIRVNPNTGAPIAADSLLNFAPGDPNAGTNPVVVSGAYTNSFAGATNSTLFNLESSQNVLTIQSPQNTGKLETVGGVGLSLGNILSFHGMDISGQTGIGYVVGQTLVTGTGLVENTLYTIDLSTGLLSVAGEITGTPQAGPLTFGDWGGGWETPTDPTWDCGDISGAGLLIDVATVPLVPEPSTIVLGGLGVLALTLAARRKLQS